MATSKFIRYFKDSATGNAASGMSVWLVDQTVISPIFPLSYLECSAHPTRTGVYYRENVSDGEYKIYIDVNGGNSPVLYEEHIWLGDNRISLKVNSIDNLLSEAHSHPNQSLLDTYTVSNENLIDARNKKHLHENMNLLDTYNFSNEDVNDAVSKKHSHAKVTVVNMSTPVPDYEGQSGFDENGYEYIAVKQSDGEKFWSLISATEYIEHNGENLQTVVSGLADDQHHHVNQTILNSFTMDMDTLISILI